MIPYLTSSNPSQVNINMPWPFMIIYFNSNWGIINASMGSEEQQCVLLGLGGLFPLEKSVQHNEFCLMT